MSTLALSRPLLICLVAVAALWHSLPAQAKSLKRPRDVAQFRRQYVERREKFTAALEELAAECARRDLREGADEVRGLAEPVNSAELRLAPLPREVQAPIPQDLPADERFWRTQLRSLQQDFSKELYLLSRTTLNAGHVGFAYDLLSEVALHDPDHSAARRILGYVRSGDEWLSAFEASMVRAKKVWHEDFGWIPRDHLERYERGERFFKNRWMSTAKETELRHDFAHAWEVRTEHYLVKTNHSLERGVLLARKLEDYYGLFFQLMAGFFNSPDQVKQLFAGSKASAPPLAKPHVVHFYRTREEYLAVVRKETTQNVGITRGIYFPRTGIAFFFDDPDSDDDSTLYHEATHQLLSGSRPQTGEVGMKSNFWIIEGIACYMESFQRDGDRLRVGNPQNPRLQAAQANYVNNHYYVPLQEFTRMGMVAFQGAPEIFKNYSQGAALTHFFMHFDDGRYREALIEHLSQIYSPIKLIRETPDSLDELTGVSAEELDQQYGEYIRNLGVHAPQNAATIDLETAR
ncbi:MAG: hypothetical protein ACKV0T_29545 [Planctomycetales bacterium]